MKSAVCRRCLLWIVGIACSRLALAAVGRWTPLGPYHGDGTPVSVSALAAADALAAVGIEATVVNARFAKPLDAERFLAIAARIGRVLTVEEHVIAGGFGSAVSELFVERGAKVELEILGVPDEWVDHGGQKLWRKHFGLDADGIAAAVRRRWPQLARDDSERESAG
jgi:deoxyxylulose-5-phosphate synthase